MRLVIACLAGTSSSAGSPALAEITGKTLLASVSTPTFATHAPGDARRLFVTELDGRVRIIDLASGTLLPTPFLTIPDVDSTGEGGLLGLAFHPDYAINGKFYALATTGGPFTLRLREYTVSSDPNVANPTPKQVVAWTKDSHHNGGWIGFNPVATGSARSYLYISSGDGLVNGASQSLTTPLGKILRIDVNGDAFPQSSDTNYAIPAGNPFAGGETADDAIWDLGLRNPWRASFDRLTGDLWIGDVGEDRIEEVNRHAAGQPGGLNFGWERREGSQDFMGGPLYPNEQNPNYEYFHLQLGDCTSADYCGKAVTGGYIYRGSDPDLYGKYVFGDFATWNFWRFNPSSPHTTIQRINDLLQDNGQELSLPTSFGEDALGNLYILSAGSGGVFRIDTSSAAMMGDFDRDRDVDGADLLAWQRGASPIPLSAADFTQWTTQFGEASVAANGAVPEPGAMVLTLVGGLALGDRRRRRSPYLP